MNTLQTGLGGFDAVCVDTKGQVFGLDETVVTSGQLILQHCGVFLADTDRKSTRLNSSHT